MFKNVRFIYITTANIEEAKAIGRVLVEEKLAACVNIMDGMESIYEWKGNIEEDHECVLIAKTHASKVSKLTQKVLDLHSYECPCVVSIPVSESEGNPEYLEWVKGEVLRDERNDSAI